MCQPELGIISFKLPVFPASRNSNTLPQTRSLNLILCMDGRTDCHPQDKKFFGGTTITFGIQNSFISLGKQPKVCFSHLSSCPCFSHSLHVPFLLALWLLPSAALDFLGEIRWGFGYGGPTWLLSAGSRPSTAMDDSQQTKAGPAILVLLWLAQVCRWYLADISKLTSFRAH